MDNQRRARRSKLWAFVFLAIYGTCLAVLIAKHEVFRDEVRIYTIARTASDPIELVRSKMVNEGHPALWYLTLWVGSRVWNNYAVLKVASLLIGLGLASVVVLASPFPFLYRCLFVVSTFPLHHFSVISRGYGLDALLMLLLAIEYSRKKAGNPWRIGSYYALLANTSVYGAMVALAFLLVPVDETLDKRYSRRSYLGVIGLLTAVGLALSLYTIWPTGDNLAMNRIGMQSFKAGYATLARETLRSVYIVLLDQKDWTGYILTGYGVQSKLSQLGYHFLPTVAGIGGILAIVALFIRLPRMLTAFAFAFIAAGLFSILVYPASIVHIGIIGTFLFALVWVAWSRYYRAESLYWQLISYSLGLSLLLHASDGIHTAWRDLYNTFSASKAAGEFLKQTYPNAVLIVEQDSFGESLPYYAENPIYLVREARFGRWVRYEAPFNRTVTLGELMNASGHLEKKTGKIVLLSLPKPIGEFQPGQFHWAYGRALEINKEDFQRFRDDFVEVAAFTEGAETYVFYKKRPQPLRDLSR